VIDVRDLAFTYAAAPEPAVRGVSFSVAAGEVFGFLGPSGAGKSTTQKILTGLLSGYAGSVRVLGREVSDWGPEYFERIGVSFELPNHYRKLTARENLEFFRSLYSVPTDDPLVLLERVGLRHDAELRVDRYSKGMQMRLTLVRALLHRPELVFLDEPTAGLDPGNARRVRDLVRELQTEGRTFFLTTHDMQVADELCTRVAFIVAGHIVQIDAPRALRIQHGRRTVRVEYREGSELAAEHFPLDGLADDLTFMTLLRSGAVETIHSEDATLEDVFIAATGRRLT
jgi:fluoroquinolone transport system ATP-binding protein